jgi:hypothetical protein
MTDAERFRDFLDRYGLICRDPLVRRFVPRAARSPYYVYVTPENYREATAWMRQNGIPTTDAVRVYHRTDPRHGGFVFGTASKERATLATLLFS